VKISILTVGLLREHDVVVARQRARRTAELLGFDRQEQTRLATAVSEIARNAFRYAGGGRVEFAVEGQTPPQILLVRVSDEGPGIANLSSILAGQYRSTTGMGIGIMGTRRLMDAFDIESVPGQGTTVSLRKLLPRATPLVTRASVAALMATLARERADDPVAEMVQQNQELLQALDELNRRRKELEELNSELEDTNRGVVALYAELDEKADHLRRADDLKSRFLSNMSHEFRTPLNSILALSRLLLDRLDGPLTDEQVKQISFMRKAAQDLFELINDLLDLAKVEAGKVVVRPGEFDVEHLFGALRGMLRPLLVHRSLNLVFEDTSGLPTLMTDESKVSQILRNFISNALKFTEQGEVRVAARLSDDGDSVVFSVKDTGIGIAPEEQEKIFEEFAQLDNYLQRRVRGTGLGLPLTRQLAQLLGGRVWLESQPGVGSTFYVSVARIYHPAETVPAPEAMAGPSRWEPDPARVPVLIVEDDPEMVHTYQGLLRGTLFQLVPARSTAEARHILRTLRPRVIVLDVMLRTEDTWGWLAELKRQDATRDIPVLVVTQIDDPQKARALGADGFALKPVDRDWLLAQLTAHSATAESRRLLVIDDDEVARYLFRNLLRDTSFVVSEAASGAEGVEMARLHKPDVIVCDMRLPGMSGLEIMGLLEDHATTRGIPIIMTTAKKLSADEHRSLERRGVTVLPKESLAHGAAAAELRRTIERVGTSA
jgi:signal transduction histidine kinase/CheY-like chemotaxis protein